MKNDDSKSNNMIQTPSEVEYKRNWNLINKMCVAFFSKIRIITAKNILFLVGDSHLEQLSFILYPYARKMGYTLLELYCYGPDICTNKCSCFAYFAK